MPVRLQKFLADAGIASRRASEQLIADGHVAVNGQTVCVIGSKVNPASDAITVDGKPVRPKKKVYLALNKPTGYVTTRSDEMGRKNVMFLLPDHWRHLHPIGRLDKDTEGLLLLTNDGAFSLRLSHPRYGITKQYVALVSGRVTKETTQKMCQGIYEKGERLKALSSRILQANNSHSTVDLELGEGKKREIRRLFAAHDHKVEKLRRIRVGSVHLGELPTGKWRTLTDAEIKSLLAKS